jgi:hypothetical protein
MFSDLLTADLHSGKVGTYLDDVQNNQQATYAYLRSRNAGASRDFLGDLEDCLQTASGDGTSVFHPLRVLGVDRKLGFDGGYHECRGWSGIESIANRRLFGSLAVT